MRRLTSQHTRALWDIDGRDMDMLSVENESDILVRYRDQLKWRGADDLNPELTAGIFAELRVLRPSKR